MNKECHYCGDDRDSGQIIICDNCNERAFQHICNDFENEKYKEIIEELKKRNNLQANLLSEANRRLKYWNQLYNENLIPSKNNYEKEKNNLEPLKNYSKG